MNGQYSSAALIIGRALHPPWNEGTRVIGWNLARAASALRPVKVISLTRESFKAEEDSHLTVEHVPTRVGYGMIGDYLGLHQVIRRANAIMAIARIGVAHLVGLPLALAPWLRHRGVRVVAHVTLVEQAYEGPIERLRGLLAHRAFDRWVDAYALSSTALRQPLLNRGLPRSKLAIVPAAIDTSLYQPGDRDQARAKLGLGRDELIVLYIGTLSPLRFPVMLIREALQQIGWQTQTAIRLFGFAPAVTHDYNRAWADSVRQQLQGIPNVIAEIVMRDMLDADKIAWYQAADAVLVPFAGPVAVEPPLTLLEAMACGAVVLVTPQANRSQLVKSGHNGFLGETPSEAADSLVRMVHRRGEPEIQCMREKARATVLRQHSFAAAAEATARLWETMARTSV
jgi:glycosyltransferase involved in cell wall biosynthesis